jgi:membrane protease YdiL (CAAX protease family)
MHRIKAFADNRPLVFALLTIVVWMLLAGVLAVGSAALLGVSMTEAVPQSAGTLGATLVLLALAGRLGWLRSLGIARLGSWRVWVATLLLLAYVILVYVYGFFGDVSYDLGVFARSDAARGILARQAIVGFVEETLFRGLVLYALVRVWGGSTRGRIAAVLVQAALFGVVHVLQAVTGSPLPVALTSMVNSFLSGVWWGAIVLSWGSLWPVIAFHTLSNASVMVRGLSTAIVEPATLAYARATLLELPLLAVGLWLLTRTPPRSETGTET